MARVRFPVIFGRSIAHYLVAIAFITLVPSFVFAGILMQRNQAAQEETVETLILATSRSLVQGVEREINANITTLRVLATSPTLHQGDYLGFHTRTVLALAGTEANLFLVDPDLYTFSSTRRAFSAERIKTAAPEATQRAFDTDQIVISDLLLGAVSRQWVYNILLPVDLGPLGRKLVALNQPADNFDTTLLANQLPEGWQTALLDNGGRIIAATEGIGRVGEVFAPFDALQLPLRNGWQSVEAPAGRSRLVVQQSSLTGWRLIAWAPDAVIAAPLRNTVLSLVAGGIILGSLIAAGLLWVSKAIGGSVRGLARDARRLGQGELVAAQDYPVEEIAEVSLALHQASARRQASEREVNFLMREVAHRSKNQMAVITAMAKQSARGAQDTASYVQAFERRIMGLASSTDLLMAHGGEGVLLTDLLASQIAPFAPEDPARVSLSGPPVRVSAQAAQTLGMAAHELSTNAVKYGAFAGDIGALAVRWARAGDRLDFTWRETVPHAVPPSDRTGFGTTVLKSMVGRALGAEVERILHDDGIEWRFSIPLSSIDPARPPASEGEAGSE